MTIVMTVTKAGKDALYSTDPNDFVMHSTYNTLKIIATGIANFTVPKSTTNGAYTLAHNQSRIPLSMAFMREETLAEAVFANNSNPDPLASLRLDSVQADGTNLIFHITNSSGTTDKAAHIRYYIFELSL